MGRFSFLALLLLVFAVEQSSAQCGYGGVNWGDVTPAGVGSSVELWNVWGGDQYTLQAQAGCEYTVSTCGGSFDTQITVFNETNTWIAYNDDFCGLQSELTFTAASTGAYTIQVNEWDCTWNLTSTYFIVTLNSCTGGCNDPTACNYDSAGTDPSLCCFGGCMTFDLFDSFGDGWNGAIYNFIDGAGVSVQSGTMPGGAAQTDLFCLPTGCYTLVVGGGSFDSEVTWFLTGAGISMSGAVGNFEVAINVVAGCTDPSADNYDPLAVCDDNSCLACYDTDPTGCPEIDCGADIVLPQCMDPCETLEVVCDVFEAGETDSYEVCGIPYSPPYSFYTGTPFSINIDDVWSGMISLPFDFCFFGNVYNEINVGSNNILSFEWTVVDEVCPWEFFDPVPSANLPLNSIMGPYHDIDPAVCGTPTYAILGTEPCRSFVVNFPDICHYWCNGIQSTTQIVLYETTNAIEVYIQDKPTCLTWNNGNAVVGIQNVTGTTGYVAEGRQTGPWSATNEAWRFTPNGASIVEVNWYSQSSGAFIGSGTTVDVCPEEPTQSYLAEATYTKCDGTTITVADDVVVSCQQIMLPVEWLEFDAEPTDAGRKVHCRWTTASEINNDFFTVERSLNAEDWEVVGTVNASGTTADNHAYQLIDHAPYVGTSYYRVRQTDFNGEFDHSITRSVKIESGEFLVYPNPGRGIFAISGNNFDRVTVFDAVGRAVHTQGLLTPEMDLSHLSRGCYFVQIWSQGGQKSDLIRLIIE